jgi:hypothetical protein
MERGRRRPRNPARRWTAAEQIELAIALGLTADAELSAAAADILWRVIQRALKNRRPS